MNPFEEIDLTIKADDVGSSLMFILYAQHMSNIWIYTPSRGKTELHCGICKTIPHRFSERRVRWADIAVAASNHTQEWLLGTTES
jgi:hypothetical protein